MKQVLVYAHPKQSFQGENEILSKLQIDNSLELGWKPEDIVLATNFPFNYAGVRSILVGTDAYNGTILQNTKTNIVVKLFEMGLIDEGLYWLHDFDVFQSDFIEEDELQMGSYDMGLTDYGRNPRPNLGSVFFSRYAEDIFRGIRRLAEDNEELDELALEDLMEEDFTLDARIKMLNITYNFQPFNIRTCYKMTDKPIRAVHFHPDTTIRQMGVNTLDWFMRGKNKINKVIMSPRLIKLFNKYGYK